MTAPNISDYQRALLCRVRDDLASGAITRQLFDMRHFGPAEDCGTVHCIGGWMRAYACADDGEWGGDWTDMNGPFRALFFPTDLREPLHDSDYAAITPQQAIIAIDLWLATGRVDWRTIMESVR